MRKRLLIGLLVVLGLVAGVMLIKSLGGKPPAPTGRRKDPAGDTTVTRRARKARNAADTLAGKAAKGAKNVIAARAGAKGQRGTMRGMTPEERKAEKKRLRDEKRRLRREMQQRRREERIALRATRWNTKRGVARSRSSRRTSLYDAYTLKATVAGTYALVGTRRLEKGDVIAGKRIVEIDSDRIVVEQYGQLFTVRLGEPIDRNIVTSGRKR